MKKIAAFFVLLILLASLLSAYAQLGSVVYEIDGMDEVTVQNVEYRTVDGTPFDGVVVGDRLALAEALRLHPGGIDTLADQVGPDRLGATL